ncbi:MAG: TIGR02281 family clan AA aspartic protease [Hyphomicrobiales bacterium]
MALPTIKILALSGAAFAVAPVAAVYMAPELFFGKEIPESTQTNLPEPTITAPEARTLQREPLPVPTIKPKMTVVSPSASGKFIVEGKIKEITVSFVFDTGASVVALTYEDAARLGIRTKPNDFLTRIETANGAVMGAEILLSEIRVGDIIIRNVPAMVMPKGAMKSSLLGRTFWGRLATGFAFNKGNLVLKD